MGTCKRVGVHSFLDLTRLGQEFLACLEEVSRNIRPVIRLKEVMKEEVGEYDFQSPK